MVVCKFWLQGNCRKGNSCNFEHPSNNRQNPNSNNSNNNNSSGGFRGAGGIFGAVSQSERWQLNEPEIRNELTDTRPKWILSAYGPNKELPAALFVENEYSPEEVRWRFYQQEYVGNGAVADQEAQQLWQKANNDMLNAAQNIKDVQKFMEEKERVHPNRFDLCKMDGTVSKEDFIKTLGGNSALAVSNPFGSGASQATTSPFSKPGAGSSPFGQNSSPFGQATQPSAFGQAKPSSPFGQPAQTPAFGQSAQPSAFGQAAQPSAFGQPAQPSAFGRPAQPTAFGKPAFGQSGAPAFGQTGFGQGANNQPTSRFGGPIANQSPFGGAASQPTSAFGPTSNLGQNTAAPAAAPGFGAGTGFGQPAQPAAFGRPAFGAAATPNTTSSFGGSTQVGSASPFSGTTQTSNANAFGGTSQTNNASPFTGAAQTNNASPFGAAAQNAPSGGGFGTNNAGTQNNQNPFNTPQQPQNQNTGSFGQSQPQQSNSFGQPQQSSPFSQASQQPQNANPFTQQQPQANPFGSNSGTNQSPFSQQTQTGFGTQNRPTAQINQPNPFPLGQGQTNQQAVNGTQSTAQSSKPTNNPVRPLHYTQSLPTGQSQMENGKLAWYRNMPVDVETTLLPTVTGKMVADVDIPRYNRPDGRGLERIWFPYASQETTVQKLARVTLDFQESEDAYDQKVKEQYAYLFENGSFKDHVIPLVPPERGWIDYDF